MEKRTTELLRELTGESRYDTFFIKNKKYFTSDSLPLCLEEIIERKNLRKGTVIREAQLNEIYGYQIFKGTRRPERSKLLCLLIAMKTGLEDAQRILKVCGYAQLYAKDLFDSIVIFSLSNGMTVAECSDLMLKHGLTELNKS